MTEDRIQIPYLDRKGVVGKRIYNYRQWLERFEQCSKTKHDTDIGPLIKEKTITGTEWDIRKHTTKFLGHWDPKQHTKQHGSSTNRNGQNQNRQISQTVQQVLLIEKKQL